ncbi:hypothetical protein CFBP5507_14890 [Agrobacterium salinitolerans]|uniref:Uncharacterized protein n=1 Tax=Agrobacterium salinitolerans TaxID=1183413 RepID=A0A4Z1QSA7_9HYPH|nr:hypothetical protein [Agrobacterium salinitolerans]UYZ09010.1 hypothetical protein CFBP5507_14890 [Agrobacterium salinitolerans]
MSLNLAANTLILLEKMLPIFGNSVSAVFYGVIQRDDTLSDALFSFPDNIPFFVIPWEQIPTHAFRDRRAHLFGPKYTHGCTYNSSSKLSDFPQPRCGQARVAYVPAKTQSWTSCLLRLSTVSCMGETRARPNSGFDSRQANVCLPDYAPSVLASHL